MNPTLGDLLTLTAKRHPSKQALLYPRKDQSWTFRELDRRVNQLARALRGSGIETGDPVSTLLHNGSEIVLTVFACARLGAVFNPINYRLAPDDVGYILGDVGSKALVFEEQTADTVRALDWKPDPSRTFYVDETPPEYATDFYDSVSGRDDSPLDTDVVETDVYSIIYTSGTTGLPKGVVHEHRDMVDHAMIYVAESGLDRRGVGLSCMPLYHCAEMHGCVFTRVLTGATNVIHHDFDPAAVLDAIGEHGVTRLFGAPTAWNALVREYRENPDEYDVSSLELGIYGAAPMPRDVLKACRNHLCEDYLQAYGMTEIGPCGTFLHPDEQFPKLGSAGLPALHHDLRIVETDADPGQTRRPGDIGEILISGPCTMRGYWNQPEETSRALREHEGVTWYYSGDLGYRDEDGYLYVVDRVDDMIQSGGENIYPTRIEDELHGHPGVREVAVVGEPDEERGERVVAYVVGDASAEELDRYCRESSAVADFARPRDYRFPDTLPKTPSGKVQRYELREESPPETDRPDPE